MKKLVFITGGATGIGKACTQLYAKSGYDVAFNYLTNDESASEIINVFSDESSEIGRAISFKGDMSDQKEIEKVFDDVERTFGKAPDILVNNAGIVHRIKFPELTGDDFERILKINTVGPYRVSREFILRQKGSLDGKSIVFIGSLRGLMQGATTIDYSATKAAIHNMTVTLAKSFSPCRVNCVAPGFTKTPMHEGNYERLDKEGEKSILKRYSDPEEIADSVLFLSSDKAKSISGEILVVDNGRSLMT